jgi:predicted Rossmann fold nucleotide-binding protein DprA/Smf involved in DNA uptake
LADSRRITIISGGQTGADRAALDFAIERGLPHGGRCPRGRLAEDGPIPLRYELRETPSRKYAQRTEWNIRDSDATLVFSIAAQPQGGTRLTLDLAERLGKPVLHLSQSSLTRESALEAMAATAAVVASAAAELRAFLAEHGVQILNVAGPRASQEPEVAAFVKVVLEAALRA